MIENTVYVLGAGFTRAFVPEAPLLVDDYKTQSLRERFEYFPHAKTILDDAFAEFGDGRVDLERLMTRVNGMPYDTADARREFALVEIALRQALVERLTQAKSGVVDRERLSAFARVIRETKASIVTFNYDDVLDAALYHDAQMQNHVLDPHLWEPDGGYGFYCRPSRACVADVPAYMGNTHTLLLKLHGSINWRSRLGEGTTYGPAGILHHEDWLQLRVEFRQPDYSRIESHLEPEPFIVPPVLAKSQLTTHPVLSVVWALAHERLKAAQNVVFIGYSLPGTDLAARTLFRESLVSKAGRKISVVDYPSNHDSSKRLVQTYRSLFPELSDANFDFSGACEWLDNRLGE